MDSVISFNSPHNFFCPTVIFIFFGEVVWEVSGTADDLLLLLVPIG